MKSTPYHIVGGLLVGATISQQVPAFIRSFHQAEITGFNWSQIEPSHRLEWHPCYKSFECARLMVPLDWNDLSNENTIAIALTRLPAVVARDDSTFAKSILLNPGGPGGSGVDTLIWEGFTIRDEIVDSVDRHFEIIGFDPRGVHHTTPAVSCFKDDWARQIFLYRNWAVGQFGSSEWCLDYKWAAYESLSSLCAASDIGRFPDGSNMHQFVTTKLTARDMLAIVDALQEETESFLRDKLGPQQTIALHTTKADLLQYWGLSYGTFLGNTFASLFPDRIGRIVLDGNVDPVDYSQTGWLKNLFDNNKNLHWFYYSCFQAGRKCALFDAKTESLFDIETKVQNLLKRLQRNPVPVVYDGEADAATFYDLTNLFHGAAYAPLYFWPDVAEAVQGLIEGNATSMIKYLKHLRIPQPDLNPVDPPSLSSLSHDKAYPYPPDYVGGLEAAISILCGDGDSLNSLTKDDWEARLAQLNNQSFIAAPFWLQIPFACHHWPESLRPHNRNRFTGPFGSKLSDYSPGGSPILFIGNTADPVTPLRNAVKNSKQHESSKVLTRDSPGHCSGPANPNACAYKVIGEYFRNGILPEEGKICPNDRSPWA